MFQIFSMFVCLFCLAVVSTTQAQTDPVRVPALFSKAYVPNGFDSNDAVQIVAEGMFRNACYRHAETTVKVDEANRRIQVGPVAYEYSGLCLQMVLPFERVIDFGILKAGIWEIVQGPQQQKIGEILIKPALRSEADDFLYAPISQAFFKQKGSESQVVLTGEFLSDCMSLEQVKSSVERDVIVLQPIVKIETRTNCQIGYFPFSTIVPIKSVPKGRYLLHVRSVNGNAVNNLVQVN